MHVERSEILDYMTYEDERPAIRAAVLKTKALRRIEVAGVLTFLFENHATVRYQILEMVRVEKIVREADIRHELETYNELLGGPGELGVTLLITIDDPDARAVKLKAWLDLNGHLYAKMADGSRVRPTWDPRQVGDDRLSSVQYLRLPVGAEAPVAIGVDHPALQGEPALTEAQRAALAADLREAAEAAS